MLCTRSVLSTPRLAIGAGVGVLCIISTRKSGVEAIRTRPLPSKSTSATATARGPRVRGPAATAYRASRPTNDDAVVTPIITATPTTPKSSAMWACVPISSPRRASTS